MDNKPNNTNLYDENTGRFSAGSSMQSEPPKSNTGSTISVGKPDGAHFTSDAFTDKLDNLFGVASKPKQENKNNFDFATKFKGLQEGKYDNYTADDLAGIVREIHNIRNNYDKHAKTIGAPSFSSALGKLNKDSIEKNKTYPMQHPNFEEMMDIILNTNDDKRATLVNSLNRRYRIPTKQVSRLLSMANLMEGKLGTGSSIDRYLSALRPEERDYVLKHKQF